MKKVVSFFLASFFCFTSVLVIAQQGGSYSRPIEEIVEPLGENVLLSGTVLVAKDGEVVFKKAYGPENLSPRTPNTVNTKYFVGPISQSFTSILVFKLIEAGKLKLEATLGSFFPSLPNEMKPIDIRHLLNHTSGIQNYPQLDGWSEDRFAKQMSDDEFIQEIAKMPILFDQGENYFYSNAGYFLLAKIVEKVSGKSYQQFLGEEILTPLKMTNTGVASDTTEIKGVAKGYIISSGGLKKHQPINMALYKGAANIYSTVDDLFKLDRALYSDELLSSWSKEVLFGKDNNFSWETEELIVPGKNDTVQVQKNSGETECFSSLFARFPVDNHTIIVLGNTGAGPLLKEKFLKELTNVIYDAPKLDSRKEVLALISRALILEDLAAATKRIVSLSYLFDIDEKLINEFGNYLSWFGEDGDAIKIYKLNTELFPESSGAWFQLAEKYKAAGQMDEAIPVYQKVLEFYPDNAYIQNIINQNTP